MQTPQQQQEPSSQQAAPPQNKVPPKTMYRVPLPNQLIPFSSPEGIQIFTEALAQGGAKPFFKLIEQFHTQNDPAFCGLGTLTMTLNALAIDPNRLWKGPWRWFSEELLDCCVPLDKVKKQGITVAQFQCLAHCNGASCKVHYASDSSLESFRADLLSFTHHFDDADPTFIITSYDRKTLRQTGSGHYSPIAAYHKERDLVLVLDVARFKYPPYFVAVEELFKALQPIDKDTGKTRAYMLISRSTRNSAAVFARICASEKQAIETEFTEALKAKIYAAKNIGAKSEVIDKLSEIVKPMIEALKQVKIIETVANEQLSKNSPILQEANDFPVFNWAILSKEHADEIRGLFNCIKVKSSFYPVIEEAIIAQNSKQIEVESSLVFLFMVAFPFESLLKNLLAESAIKEWKEVEAEVKNHKLVYGEVKALRAQIQAIVSLEGCCESVCACQVKSV